MVVGPCIAGALHADVLCSGAAARVQNQQHLRQVVGGGCSENSLSVHMAFPVQLECFDDRSPWTHLQQYTCNNIPARSRCAGTQDSWRDAWRHSRHSPPGKSASRGVERAGQITRCQGPTISCSEHCASYLRGHVGIEGQRLSDLLLLWGLLSSSLLNFNAGYDAGDVGVAPKLPAPRRYA